MCDCSRQKYAEFAFRQPFPYGLTKKMAARTIYHARKLEVWASRSAASAQQKAAILNTLKSISMLTEWSSWCLSLKGLEDIHNIEKYPEVYQPAEDSFLLADAALLELERFSRFWQGNILEIGCGSGIISYIMQTTTKAKVRAVDINAQAVECARQNGIDAVQSDLFENVQGKFDLIVFNPPYLPDDTGEHENNRYDHALYGGPTGREVIYKFLEGAGEYLDEKGIILIVISTHTGVEELKTKAVGLGYHIEKIDTFENLSTWRVQRCPV